MGEAAWASARFLKHAPQGVLVPRVLVADDNSNIQKTATLALKDAGIDVVAVSNGEAAVRKLADLTPDLILADIFMPVRSGYELCEYVKHHSRYSQVPVILLVGAFEPFDENEARRVQADGVLKKPFVPADPLVNMVKALLARLSSENLGEDTVAVSPGPSFSPVEAFHSGPSRADLARAATRTSQASAGTLTHSLPMPQPSAATDDFNLPELATSEFATPGQFEREPGAPSNCHDGQPGVDSVLELPDAEAEADLVSTSSRDPILGEPAFWSPTTKVDDEPSAEITEGHNWGFGPAPEHEEEVLPAFEAAAETQIESAIAPATSGDGSDVAASQHDFGATAEFEAGTFEVSRNSDSVVAHDEPAASTGESAPQLDAPSTHNPAIDLASDRPPDLVLDSAPESAPESGLDSGLNLELNRASDSTSASTFDATPVPSPYDDSDTPHDAVEEAAAPTEPPWQSQTVDEWELIAATVHPPAAEPESSTQTEVLPKLDVVCEPVETRATEPERALETALDCRTSVDTDSESHPETQCNTRHEFEAEPQADPYAATSAAPECGTPETVGEQVHVAREIVADESAQHELESEPQRDSSATSVAPECETQGHVPEPVIAAHNLVADSTPSTMPADEPSAAACGHEFEPAESAGAHNEPSGAAASDSLYRAATPWTSLHWSAALQDPEALAGGSLPKLPEIPAPEAPTPSESDRDNDLATGSNVPEGASQGASDVSSGVAPSPIEADPEKPVSVEPSAPAREPLTTEEIEATVTRIVERMQPRVTELLTREILRPIIEALVQGELSKR
jgi:CheY-like chemotaxis protein